MSNLLIQQYNDDQEVNTTEQELTPNDEQWMPNQWKSVKLGAIAKEFISGGTPSTKRTELWDGIIPWTTSATISEDAITYNIAQRFITEQGLQESASHVVPHGNLLVGTRVGVGKAVVNLLDIAISQDITGIVLKEVAQPDFIAYQFKTDRLQRIFKGYKRGTTIQGISRFDLQSLKLYLPPLPEQHTVAYVLHTVQQAIQTRHKELKLERERKAALMHYLFTYGMRKEATKQSEVGEIPESWEVVRLGNIIRIKYGYQTSIPSTPPSGGIDIISTAEILNEGILNLTKIRTVEIPKKLVENYRVHKNDVLFNWRNAQEHVGKCAIIDFDPIKPTIFASFILALRTGEKINYKYLHLLLTYFRQKGIFFKLSRRAVNQANFNANELGNLNIPLPPLVEQIKLTEILSALDNKIAALKHEIILHEELFRALLDELMTGHISTLPLVEQLEKGTLTYEQRTSDGTGTTH